MTFKRFGREICRRSLVVITCFVLISGGASGLFAQSSTAAISGIILDPEGHPAFGFKVVFRDVGSGTRYSSGPTDAAGNYAIQVPLGGRYKLEGVVADDGVTKLPVQDIPPISVLTPGTTRMNVRFTNQPAAAAAPPPATTSANTPATTPTAKPTPKAQPASTAPARNENQKKLVKAKGPWYKRPGPIVGMVVGGVVILALAAGGGGGGGGVASQSTPTQ
jgi:hypothetical protein